MRKDVEKLLAHFDVPGDKKPAPVPVFTIEHKYVGRGNKRGAVAPQVVKMLVIDMMRNKRSKKVTVVIVSKHQYDKLGRFGGYGVEYDLDIFARPVDNRGFVFKEAEAKAVVGRMIDDANAKKLGGLLERKLAQEKLVKLMSAKMPKLDREIARASAKLTGKKRAAVKREARNRVRKMGKSTRVSYGCELTTTALS